MGNNQSAIDPVHLRIYSNIIQIRDPLKRVQMINTCLSSMEYVGSAKRAGIYSYLLNYIGMVNSGGSPPLLPGEQQQQQQQRQQPVSGSLQGNFQAAGTQIITRTDNTPSWKVITDTSKQKAMSYFSSCLEVLNIRKKWH